MLSTKMTEILGIKYPQIRRALEEFRHSHTDAVLSQPDPA